MKKINTNKLINFVAVFVSLTTLYTFIYQTKIIREQSRLSVTPRVSFDMVTSSSINIKNIIGLKDTITVIDTIIQHSLDLKNKGLGPAIIDSVNLFSINQNIEVSIRSFLERKKPNYSAFLNLESSTSINDGETLSQNEIINLYTISYHRKDINAVESLFDVSTDILDFEIEVYYSSIYKEQWKVNLKKTGNPIKLKS